MTPQPPRTVDLFVSGRWQPPGSGRYEPATSPVTGELIGQVAQGDRADAGTAVQAAAGALGRWAAATAFERAHALHRVADACQRRRDELARALTLDQGKPLHAVEALSQVRTIVLSGLS
jgi:acyl-CoA reductase-like NAD-dependent aldehyde dehydrogenase